MKYILLLLLLFGGMSTNVMSYSPGDILLKKSDKDGVLNEIRWGQSKNNTNGCSPSYNAQCPSNIGEIEQCQNKLAGCGAIAIGQIMAMWQYPAKSKYRTYNWNNIPPVLRDGDSEDCPLLIKDIGNACNMHYEVFGIVEITGSWCTSNNIEDALETFSYNVKSCSQKDWLRYNTLENWYSFIRNEIDCGRPVIMFGKNGSIFKSHYFVIDGYSSSNPNLFHVNWGWKGNDNEFWDLSSCKYKDDRIIFYGICPKRTNAPKITYQKIHNYIIPNCSADFNGYVQYKVENADTWICNVYDRNGKVLMLSGGAVKDGIAKVWDGSSVSKLEQTDYWYDVIFMNSKGSQVSLSSHVTYMPSWYKKEIKCSLNNDIYTPNCEVDGNNFIEIITNNVLDYTASIYDSYKSLLWSGQGKVVNGVIRINPQLENFSNGSITLKLNLNGGCNCKASEEFSYDIYYDDFSCREFTNEYKVFSGKVSPIRVVCRNSQLEIKSEEEIDVLSIYSISGILLKQENSVGRFQTLELDDFQNGLLVVVIKTESGIYSERISVNKD